MIALESEIIASRYDPQTRTCFYTIERNGKRWTVSIPLRHFEDMGVRVSNKQKRRDHLANVLENAMRGPHDGEV